MSRSVALADGGRVAVVERGSGPPILLLRPLGGSIDSWEPFAAALAARLRVIAFDPRGAGRSSSPSLLTTTRRMAVDAVAVLDALAIERAHVYGLSLGGMVASWLAVDAADRVDRLVLASTAIRGWSVSFGDGPRCVRLARCLWRKPEEAEACLATQVLSRAFRAAHPEEVARIETRARAHPGSHRDRLVLLMAAARHDVGSGLARIRAATLVVAGGRDTLLPLAAQQRLAARLARASFVAIPEAGHDVSAEAPAAVAALVIAHVLASDAAGSRAATTR